MKFSTKMLFILLLQTIVCLGQETENKCIENTVINLQSDILEQPRTIKIRLPEGYSQNQKYPVLYITDANYNFEVASFYLSQLIKSNTVPKCILVGVTQQNRYEELDPFWSETGKQFKDFLFKELVPHINATYSTSGFNAIIGHSDGAEYNHFLMIQKDNPFRGFVNMSENLNADVTQQIATYFKTYNGKKVFYFIASATYDSPDRIAAGKTIQAAYNNNQNANIAFQNKLYNANHQTIVTKSLLDGIMYIFKDYRELTQYNGFKDYVANYKTNINNYYGFVPDANEDDIDYFFGRILDDKDVIMYEYIVAYVTENNIFQISSYNRSWHYFHMGEHEKSIAQWTKTINDMQDTSPRVFYYNFEKAIKSYQKLNNPKGAITFLEASKKAFPQYTLEFNYFIAKVALENNIQKSKAKKKIKYCEQNYYDNKYFDKEDLDQLKTKV